MIKMPSHAALTLCYYHYHSQSLHRNGRDHGQYPAQLMLNGYVSVLPSHIPSQYFEAAPIVSADWLYLSLEWCFTLHGMDASMS